MARITSKKQQKNKRARTKKQRQLTENRTDDKSIPPSSPPAIVESHRFMSSITFDGKTLRTKTQKDNEPAVETIYTKNQLAEDIPLGNKMVDLYLDGEMPEELQRHHKGNGDNGVFKNVLINPADLGLLPPSTGRFNRKEHESQTRHRRRRHGRRHISKKHMFDLPYYA